MCRPVCECSRNKCTDHITEEIGACHVAGLGDIPPQSCLQFRQKRSIGETTDADGLRSRAASEISLISADESGDFARSPAGSSFAAAGVFGGSTANVSAGRATRVAG